MIACSYILFGFIGTLITEECDFVLFELQLLQVCIPIGLLYQFSSWEPSGLFFIDFIRHASRILLLETLFITLENSTILVFLLYEMFYLFFLSDPWDE